MFEKFPVPFQKFKQVLIESFVNWPKLPTGNPSNNRHPANKGYVDTQIQANTTRVLLDYQSITSQSAVTVTGKITADFKQYRFSGRNIKPATDGATTLLRTSSNNGSSYDSGASDYITWRAAFESSTHSGGSGATSIQMTAAGIGNASTESLNFDVDFYDPLETSLHKLFKGETWYLFTDSAPYGSIFNGKRSSSSAVNALQFLFSSGNIASGEFFLYGYR